MTFTLTGIALPVALVVIVTSVSLGMAATGTVQSPDIDYWIVPESGASSPVVSVEGPQLGNVHTVSRRLTGLAKVTHATPVLIDLIRVGNTTGGVFIIAIGLIPGPEPVELAGTSTAGLSPGDPHYANGTYSGRWTGDLILSSGAASMTDLGRGNSTVVAGNGSRSRRFTVINVSRGASAATDFPLAIMRLSELQSLTGSTGGDSADQILVRTTEPKVRAELETVYPRSLVVEKGGLHTKQIFRSELAVTLAILTVVVALIVGVLFTATTLGLSVAATSRERAILAALGFSGRTIALIIGLEAGLLAVVGGLVGVGIGWAAIPIANLLSSQLLEETAVARAEPLLIPFGIAIALTIAILIQPYLIVISNRMAVVDALTE